MASVKHQHLPMPQITGLCRHFVARRYHDDVHADAADEILHVISGKVRVQLETGEEYSAEKNETLFIPRGMRHKDIFELQTGLEVFLIHFKWSASRKFFSYAAPDCLKNLSGRNKNELLLLFDMFRLDQYSEPENVTMAETRLAHLLGIAWRHVFSSCRNPAAKNSYSRLAAFAYDYMRGHLSSELTIDSVAAELKVSRSTLIRAFHYSSGMSFNACLRSLRMNEAYSMLKERGLSASECAVRCGYSDPAYFSRVFKKHFGFSPKNII